MRTEVRQVVDRWRAVFPLTVGKEPGKRVCASRFIPLDIICSRIVCDHLRKQRDAEAMGVAGVNFRGCRVWSTTPQRQGPSIRCVQLDTAAIDVFLSIAYRISLLQQPGRVITPALKVTCRSQVLTQAFHLPPRTRVKGSKKLVAGSRHIMPSMATDGKVISLRVHEFLGRAPADPTAYKPALAAARALAKTAQKRSEWTQGGSLKTAAAWTLDNADVQKVTMDGGVGGFLAAFSTLQTGPGVDSSNSSNINMCFRRYSTGQTRHDSSAMVADLKTRDRNAQIEALVDESSSMKTGRQ